MHCWKKILAVLLIFAGGSVLLPEESHAAGKTPLPEEVNKIAAAVPGRPTVKPLKPRRLLVFSKAWGYQHSAIPYGRAAVEIMAKKTGAFEAVISDDLSLFEPANLRQFDAVLFNNTNEEIFLPEKVDVLPSNEQAEAQKRDRALKKSLADFIAGGKGLAVIHAGVASFREWPEFGNIIGARFDNHPWTAGSTVTLKVDDPGHPVARAFAQTHFEVTDEIYQVKDPYSRDKLRVLLSIDTTKTYIRLDRVKTIHRRDNDFAISWVKSYGQGRVFYCALGHQHDIFWNPVILQHFLDGIQFALGDLKGDTTPSARVRTRLSSGGAKK